MPTPAETLSLERPAGSGRPPAVFTVSPVRPFLRALAAAILAGDLPRPGGVPADPLSLADVTVLLPTRRAARALQEAFLAAGGGRAMLLPRIRPIAETDEDLSLIASAAGASAGAADAGHVPPAVSSVERRLVLTNLVLQWNRSRHAAIGGEAGDMSAHGGAGRDTPAQAARLAFELERLMDEVETEERSLDQLAGLVPDDFSDHWQATIEFLKIVTEFWPLHLDERGLLSPVARRNQLILEEAVRLAADPPQHPVIVAGVTGSIPATVALMRAVARLPKGAIVLPGLDLRLDTASWQAIVPNHPEHPQFGLCKLLASLGIDRADVQELPGAQPLPARRMERVALIGEAMRPAATTGRWHALIANTDKAAAADALNGLSLIEAPTAQDEAELVALILRQAIETPGRSAALVSPDRLLARAVVARLESWGIRADDSAGRPLAKTVPGAFLSLAIGAAAADFAPAELMALLNHPLCRLGLAPFAARRAARALEIAAFRTVYLGRGLDGVERALDRAHAERDSGTRRHAAVRRLWPEDWDGARDLVARLKAAFAPLLAAYAKGGRQPLRNIIAAHLAAAEALVRLPEEEAEATTSSPLWQNEAGEAASLFFAGLMDDTIPGLEIRAADYADLYRTLISTENVRARLPTHPRIAIWGPLEARLQQADVLVLGSLNEGTWPEAADPGPWLNRPMRAALGLPAPEERIGRAAHDFTALLGAERVYLTRAKKIDGVPTVPSRWLMRLEALLAGMGLSDVLDPTEPWLGWARARDHVPGGRIAIAPPAPRPPVEVRPRKLSVSKIETWIANPYAIYADRILKLEPLPALAGPPDASLKGALVHEMLARFAKRFPDALPAEPLAALMAIAREVIAAHDEHPRVAALWLPRMERFARWFAETEAARRRGVVAIHPEVSGQMVLEAPAGPFTLTARADRIDVAPSGLVITDYKTGQAPNDARVLAGVNPQLPLEAAIAAAEGFDRIIERRLGALRYIRASGGEPPGEERTVQTQDVAKVAADALAGLARLVALFDDPATPYAAARRERFRYDFDAYAQLARVNEWSSPWDEEANP